MDLSVCLEDENQCNNSVVDDAVVELKEKQSPKISVEEENEDRISNFCANPDGAGNSCEAAQHSAHRGRRPGYAATLVGMLIFK